MRIACVIWGGRWESNPQRPEPQSGALPVELRPPFREGNYRVELDYSRWKTSSRGPSLGFSASEFVIVEVYLSTVRGSGWVCNTKA